MKWKLPIIISGVVALLCFGAGWFQSRQLIDLRSYSKALRAENAELLRATQVDSHLTKQEQHQNDAAPPVDLTGKSHTDARAIVTFLESTDLKDATNRPKALALLTQLADAPAMTLHALLEQLPESGLLKDHQAEMREIVLVTLAEKDPSFALGQLLEVRQLESKNYGQKRSVEGILRSWYVREPVAAIAWAAASLAEQPSPKETDSSQTLAYAIGRGLANQSPKAVLDLVAHSEVEHRSQLLRGAAQAIENGEIWLKFARSSIAHEDDELRRSALTALAKGLRVNDAVENVRQLVEQLALPPDLLDRFLIETAARHIDSQTADRANWMIDRSSPENLHTNLDRLMTKWTNQDFNGAALWLKSLEPSPTRDRAVARFALTLAAEEPDAALLWAKTLEDPHLRRTTRINIEKQRGVEK